MGYGFRIRLALQMQGRSAAWLARVTNIPVNTIYGIIRRDSESLTTDKLNAIADALNIPVDILSSNNGVFSTYLTTDKFRNSIPEEEKIIFPDGSTKVFKLYDKYGTPVIELDAETIDKISALLEALKKS